MSCPGVVFLIVLWLAMLAPLGVSASGHLAWLDYLYIVSYIKLVVTPIKYIPQVSWGMHLYPICDVDQRTDGNL